MASGSTSLFLSMQSNPSISLPNVKSKQMPFEFGRNDEPFAEERGPLLVDYALNDLKPFASKDRKLREEIGLLEAQKRAKSLMKAFLQEKAKKFKKRQEQTQSQDDGTMDPEEVEILVPVKLVPPMYSELAKIELSSFIFKLWLRRIELTREEDYEKYSSLHDFELAIYNALETIKRYRDFIIKEYYHEHELRQRSPFHAKSFEEDSTKVLEEKEKSGFEMIDEDLALFRRRTFRLNALLGLKLDFLDRLEAIPEDHLLHRSLGDWINIFLQNNIRSVSSENKASLTIDLLDSIGFDPLSTAVETIMERSSKGNTQNHIEACEWAEIFIQDELKYNPFLSPQVLQFPFQSNLTNSWFQLPNTCYEENESDLNPCEVNIMNFVTKESRASSDVQSALNGFLSQSEHSTTLFHGTDHHSAVEILLQGIDLCAGRQNRDFSCGSGFYLTKNMDEALNWAQSTTAKPAILVFQVTKQHLDSAKILNLSTDEERWLEVVHSFRSGRRTAKTRESLSSYDLIEGPQATVKRDAGELVLEKKPSSYQVCLISEDFAEMFEKTLHSILFLDISST
ncbi:uncharacterized protein [Montipora foliosa]|uniref:uncharacterized protein n=1 Tax=Montipora foliosa TaxID=591990 RepID=UPI0035F1B664